MQPVNDRSLRLSIAPMMDRTDRHFRYFMRLLSPHVRLYTEMITTGAILHGDRERFLSYDKSEHPVAVQLGGSDSKALKACSKICDDYGYDEINLNVGCPSDRVQSGAFGACLMNEPERVAECVDAMIQSTDIPVTVKCRTGVDDRDSYDDLYQFIKCVSSAGCQIFFIHARKAWLSGLSPKENREIPPLDYNRVYQIKHDFPDLSIVINGGFTQLDQIEQQLSHVDGVMIGRAAYANPWLIHQANSLFEEDQNMMTRLEILQSLIPYAQKQVDSGQRLSHITRHILGLYQHCPGARQYRRWLSENAHKQNAGVEVIEKAILMMSEYK